MLDGKPHRALLFHPQAQDPRNKTRRPVAVAGQCWRSTSPMRTALRSTEPTTGRSNTAPGHGCFAQLTPIILDPRQAPPRRIRVPRFGQDRNVAEVVRLREVWRCHPNSTIRPRGCFTESPRSRNDRQTDGSPSHHAASGGRLSSHGPQIDRETRFLGPRLPRREPLRRGTGPSSYSVASFREVDIETPQGRPPLGSKIKHPATPFRLTLGHKCQPTTTIQRTGRCRGPESRRSQWHGIVSRGRLR